MGWDRYNGAMISRAFSDAGTRPWVKNTFNIDFLLWASRKLYKSHIILPLEPGSTYFFDFQFSNIYELKEYWSDMFWRALVRKMMWKGVAGLARSLSERLKSEWELAHLYPYQTKSNRLALNDFFIDISNRFGIEQHPKSQIDIRKNFCMKCLNNNRN